MAEIKPLNSKLQKIANEELNEVPSRISQDLDILKLWIKQQPHLKARMDDQFLVQFLRGCKYSLEKAKEKIDLFYSLKTQYPEMMNATNVDDTKFRQVYRTGCFLPLPATLNDNGPRILVLRFNYCPTKYSIDDIYGMINAIHELLVVRDPNAGICGITYIADFKNATAAHYLQMTPNFCKKILSFVEKSLPLRIKSAYYINTSSMAQHFFEILFPFMSKKLRQRLHIMGSDLGKLLQDIPPQYLPQDYGGDLPCFDELLKDYEKTWDANRDYFKENAQYGTDESLRLGKPLDIEGLFGVGGSFRKLIVD